MELMMSVRYIQMGVSQEDYDKVASGAFKEKLTLSEFLEKAVIFYLKNCEKEEDKLKTYKKALST